MGNRSFNTILALVIGLPLGLGLLAVMLCTPLARTEFAEYVSHPVEKVTVLMFGLGLGALLGKLAGYRRELAAFRCDFLPAWDGEPVSVESAVSLRDEVEPQLGRLRSTMLGRRVLDVLEFVESRRSANELDDQLRNLADNDEIALDGSYALVRFISWAIPILGFLGTVLGITLAVANVNPETLEKNLNAVTGGLATAFNATALALALTMVVMFCTFIVEQLEQRILERVNRFAEEQLGHRFERSGSESNEFVEVVRRNTQVLIEASEDLVQRQAALWGQSMEEARRAWLETGQTQQQQVAAAMEKALERTASAHAKRLAEQEQLSQRSAAVIVDRLQQLSATLAGTAQQQQAALTQLLQKAAAQTEVLTRLADSGSQLAKLQQLLQQNLGTLANAGSFDQAVSSLTAAIHLLTARAGGSALAVARGTNRLGEAA
jgi:biopolymer transport protein ExbB/TolQ